MSPTEARIVAHLTRPQSQQDLCFRLDLTWDEVQEALRHLLASRVVVVQLDGRLALRASVVPEKRGWG